MGDTEKKTITLYLCKSVKARGFDGPAVHEVLPTRGDPLAIDRLKTRGYRTREERDELVRAEAAEVATAKRAAEAEKPQSESKTPARKTERKG